MKKFDLALQNLQTALRLAPANMDAAAADFSLAIEADATESWDYINRALVFFKKGAYEQAVADLQRAISINPAQIDAYIGLSESYEKLGKTKEAEEARAAARQFREKQGAKKE